MYRNLILAVTLIVAITSSPIGAQDTPRFHEVRLPESVSLGGEYRIPLASLLEEGEENADFYLLQQPSLGTVVQEGDFLIFQPLADFALAAGDVFVYAVDPERQDGVTRLALLSPAPPETQQSFSHDFELNYDGWTLSPRPGDHQDGDFDDNVFSFEKNSDGSYSLEAKLGGESRYLFRQEDGYPIIIDSNGSWGGGTTLIVCPDDDPDKGRFPAGSDGDGEAVVYRVTDDSMNPLLQLRVMRKGGAWMTRVETLGVACVAGDCESQPLDLQSGSREVVEILVEQDVTQPRVFLSVTDPTSGTSEVVTIPSGIEWDLVDHHRLGVMDQVGLKGQRLLIDDFSTTGYFDPFDRRVSDDFESAGFGDGWDDTSEAADLVVSSRAAVRGIWGLELDPWRVVAGAEESWLQEITDQAKESYGIRFALDTSAIALPPGQSLPILGASSTVHPEAEHMGLSLVGTAAGNSLQGMATGDWGRPAETTSQVLLSPGNHVIIMRWTSGTPGNLSIWLDGSLAASMAVNNPSKRVQSSRLGVLSTIGLSPEDEQEGFVRIDSVVAW